MRRYIDLSVDSRNIPLEDLKDMIDIACSMNFTALGVKLDAKAREQDLKLLKQLSREYGIDLAARIDLTPRSKTRLLRDLRVSQEMFEVTAVHTESVQLARTAIRDDRVDLISITSKDSGAAFRPSIARLIAPTGKAVEFELSSLILLKGQERIDLLSRMRRCVRLAKIFHVNVVISSGATDKYMLRSPMDQASIAHLIGMTLSTALDSLSIVPQSILERNRARLDPRQISSGVKITEGKDDACSPH
jgi:ribonuclease P/MRP protein subunit RPP1